MADLAFLLSTAAHSLQTELTARLEHLGLTPRAQCVLIKALEGEQTQIRLAERCGLDKTTMSLTLKRLEEDGYILGRVALLDPERLGLGLTVFVQLKTQRHDSAWLEQFAATVTGFEEVMEFYRMSGDWD